MKNKLAAAYESILIKLDDFTFSQLDSMYAVPVDVLRLCIWVLLVSLVCIIKLILCLFL